MKSKVKYRVVYTRKWFYSVVAQLLRDAVRSVAFGVFMSLSVIFLFAVPLLIVTETIDGNGSADPGVTVAVLAYVFLGLPLCVLCWWAALEVADDRHWEKPVPTIWEDQQTRWLEYTVKYVRYLESQGRSIDTSIVLSRDIRAAAHRLIEGTDEGTVRLLLSVVLASRAAETASTRRQLEDCREV